MSNQTDTSQVIKPGSSSLMLPGNGAASLVTPNDSLAPAPGGVFIVTHGKMDCKEKPWDCFLKLKGIYEVVNVS